MLFRVAWRSARCSGVTGERRLSRPADKYRITLRVGEGTVARTIRIIVRALKAKI